MQWVLRQLGSLYVPWLEQAGRVNMGLFTYNESQKTRESLSYRNATKSPVCSRDGWGTNRALMR